MSVIINGTTGITSPGGDVSAVDNTVSGLTVGKGGGSQSNSVAIGQSALAAVDTGYNVAVGYQALKLNTGAGNTGVGYISLAANTSGAGLAAFGNSTLAVNTTGANNTAVGNTAVTANTTGSANTGIGAGALAANTTASNNTAVGYQAGYSNTTGGAVTFVGYQAGYSNTGDYNAAFGTAAGYSTTSGTNNSSFGAAALYANTTGSSNTAIGRESLRFNTTASYNTAVGYQAGYTGTTTQYNTFMGYQAGYAVTTGNGGNTFIGFGAGNSVTTGAYNTFIGPAGPSYNSGNAMTTGSKNTIIGAYSGNNGGLDIRTLSNYIVLSDGDGNPRGYFPDYGTWTVIQTANSQAGMFQNTNSGFNGDVLLTKASRTTTDATFRAFAYYNTGSSAYKFWVADSGNCQNTNGSYGSFSDAKLKENIVDATPKLDDLMKVKIRNYNLKNDESKLKQIGVIAQELETVFPSLIEETKDLDGDGNDLGTTTKGVKYSIFVPMLIKAIQELKAEFDAYKATHP